MSAIRFDHGHVCEHMPMELGGRTVWIWKPTAIIDDQTLDELNVEQGFVGMQEEIHNLEHCKTGKTISETEMKSFRKNFPNARLISSRWVAAFKSTERVRTRIVAKDFNRGQSARSLGFSSPTPSIEALHLILAISATRRYLLRSLDISHAFMHSPLGKDMHVVLKLPLSVSLEDGQPAFLVLDKALNGLRFLMFCAIGVLWLCDVVVFYPWQVVLKASHCWLQLLSETVKTIGLWTDSIEPCVYSGAVYDRDTHTPGTCLSHSLCRRHLACLVDGRGRSICRGHHFQGCSDQDHRTDSTGRRVAHIHWLNHPTSCSRR